MRKLLVAITAAATVMAASPAMAQVAPEHVAATPAVACTQLYTVQEYRHYVSRVYRRPHISKRARKQMHHMYRCPVRVADQPRLKRIRHHQAKLRKKRAAAYNVGYVLPWRIVACESGGNWRAVNDTPAGRAAGRPAGAYQIVTSTWLAHGGGRFAPTADRATPRQQNVVVLRIWRGGAGAGQWECR